MASYKFIPTTKKVRVFFRYGGKQFNKTLGADTDREAGRTCALIEQTVEDLERGRLTMPPDADPAAFISSGGKVSSRPGFASDEAGPKPPTLGEVLTIYAETLTPGSKESNTPTTELVHSRHFRRVIGDGFVFDSLDIASIQRYVDKRHKENVGRETIHKELATLRVIWGWALKRRHVTTPLTWKMADLTLPKAREKPPFQTWGQIARRIERGDLTVEKQDELWECLWLDQEQTRECLAWVEENGKYSFIHPMFAFAVYTGTRRSEIIRSEKEDWDFEAGQVTIREKKSERSKTFTRRLVPIHPALDRVMRMWFTSHPGGLWTIAKDDGAPLSANAAAKFFRRTMRGSKRLFGIFSL